MKRALGFRGHMHRISAGGRKLIRIVAWAFLRLLKGGLDQVLL